MAPMRASTERFVLVATFAAIVAAACVAGARPWEQRPAPPATEPSPQPPAPELRGEITPPLPVTPPKPVSWSESFRMVTRGLAWLASQQQPDGSWGDPATTGIALFAFLGAGETHQQGRHR